VYYTAYGCTYTYIRSWDRLVNKVTGYRLKERGSISGRDKWVSFHLRVLIGSEGYPTSYPIGNGDSI